MNNLLTFKEFAERVGVAPSTITKAVKAGRILHGVVEKSGKRYINPLVGDIEFERNTSHAKRRKQKKKEESSPVDKTSGDTFDGYNQSRATKEKYSALKARLEYKQLDETLVGVREVEKAQFNLWRSIREKILNIPNRISHELAIETDSKKIHNKLTEELVDSLTEITNPSKSE